MFLFSGDCEKRNVVTINVCMDEMLNPGESDYIGSSLNILGIDDVKKYVVVSVEQSTASGNMNAKNITAHTGSDGKTYPYAITDGSDNTIRIYVINDSESPAYIAARVVMMQIA